MTDFICQVAAGLYAAFTGFVLLVTALFPLLPQQAALGLSVVGASAAGYAGYASAKLFRGR